MRATVITDESAVTVTPRTPRTATSLQDGEPTEMTVGSYPFVLTAQ